MGRKETNQRYWLAFTLVFQVVLFGTELRAHENHSTSKLTASYVEIKAKIEEFQSDDFTNKKSQRHYFAIDTATNTRLEIHFDKKAPKHFKTGNIIELKGIQKGSDLYLNSEEAENFAYAGMTGSTGSYDTSAAVTGSQNTLVLLIDSTTSAVSCSGAQVTDFMFSNVGKSINYMYQEASYGALSFYGTVYEHVKIDVPSKDLCDYSSWSSKALTTAGISSGSYGKVVYVLPPDNACGWAGLGMIGSKGAWINGRSCGTPDVYAHELGHNLGMGHANAASEYGDTSDIMGYGGVGLRTVNAPHKLQMGWMPLSKVQAGAKGNFNIAPLELDPAATSLPQAVSLRKANGEILYLSYRRKIGYDSILNSTYADRLSLHTGSYTTTLKGTLGDGQSYTDAADGFTITVLSHNLDSISVQIDAECHPNAPTLSLSPATQGVAAGQSATFNISLKNNDSLLCESNTYNLSSVLPADFTGSFSSSSISLIPGATGSASLIISSPLAVTGGEFNFQINVSGPDVIHAVSASAKVVIDGQAPSAPGNLSYTTAKNKVYLLWTGSTDNVAVSGYEIFRNGALLATVPGYSSGYTVTKSRTTVTYTVRAIDAAGNKSAFSNAVTINGR